MAAPRIQFRRNTHKKAVIDGVLYDTYIVNDGFDSYIVSIPSDTPPEEITAALDTKISGYGDREPA